MSILSIKTRSLISSAIAGLLVTSFIFAPIAQNSSHGLKIQTVEAIPVFDAANFKVNLGDWIAGLGDLAVDTITAESSLSLELKEFILDFSAWTIVNLVLQEMIRSVTAWVNSGFQGSPAFVTDLRGFLLNIADKVVGNFIWNGPLQALCSPFKLNIQSALALQYAKTRSYEAKCRLSSVVHNVQNFMNGDFLEGGWNGWYNMTLTPQNNQFGALMEADFALNANITNAKGQQIKLLDFGRGLFSKKDANGKIVTPGATIETQLNKALGLPADRLVVADEINELIGALFSQLVSKIFSSASGLAGLNSDTNSSGQSYFDLIDADEQLKGTSERELTVFTRAFDPLNVFIGHQRNILQKIDYAEHYMETAYPTCSTTLGDLTGSLISKQTEARRSLGSATSTLDTLKGYKSDYDTLGSTTAEVTVKRTIMTKWAKSSAAETQVLVMNTFEAYAKPEIPKIQDENIALQTKKIPDLTIEIAQFTKNIDDECQRQAQSNGNNSTNNTNLNSGGN